MKKISIYLFFLFFLTDKAFAASKSLIKTGCVGFKKYYYWKNHDTGLIEKEYFTICDEGPLGFIPWFISNPPVIVIIVVIGIILIIVKYEKTPEEIKKVKKAEEKKKRIKEEQRLIREERKTEKEVSSSDIGARLKKLRQMYKDGILSKIEFEKAKNKLLK